MQVLNVVMLLQDACAGTEETFSQQDIQRMIGILKTNGMKLEPHGPEKGISGVGLYPIYCLLNHSCYSNTNYVKFPDYHLELRSQVPIKRGEEISTRYISATIGMYRKCEVQGLGEREVAFQAAQCQFLWVSDRCFLAEQ